MICKHCYEVFCDNTFGKMATFETEEERQRYYDTRKVIHNGKELNFVKMQRNMSQEEFDRIKQTKQSSFFLVLARNYKDNLGFSKIEYL
jgi:hypothetical protein